jgi:hypothetical protein
MKPFKIAIVGFVALVMASFALPGSANFVDKEKHHLTTSVAETHAVLHAYDHVSSSFTAPLNFASIMAPQTGAKFKTVTITGDTVARINAYGTDDQNYYTQAGDTFRLYLSNIRDGGNYRWLIKKTVSGVVLIHCTAMTVVGGGTTLSLSGSTNTYFWVNFTKHGSTLVIHKE